MKATRLLTSLEQMTDQEGMYLRGGFYDLAVAVRQRADPLVRLLVELAGRPEVSGLRDRAIALVSQSDGHAVFLQSKMQELGQEIRRTDQARFRTAQLAPAYTQATEIAAARFEAAG